MLKQEFLLRSSEYVPLAVENFTCKTIYNTLLNHQHFPPPTAKRSLVERGFIFHFLSVSQMTGKIIHVSI